MYICGVDNGVGVKQKDMENNNWVVAYYEGAGHAEIAGIFMNETDYHVCMESMENEATVHGMRLIETCGLCWEEVREIIEG